MYQKHTDHESKGAVPIWKISNLSTCTLRTWEGIIEWRRTGNGRYSTRQFTKCTVFARYSILGCHVSKWDTLRQVLQGIRKWCATWYLSIKPTALGKHHLYLARGSFPVTSLITFTWAIIYSYTPWNNCYRLEIWYILGTKDFRHRVNTKHVEQRALNFKRMYKLVRNDRETNSTAAWNVRRAQLNLDDADMRTSIAKSHGGINFDDLDSF